MSTRVKTPVGPSTSTPSMAVHPAGSASEVSGPVPDIPGAGPAGTPVPAPVPVPVPVPGSVPAGVTVTPPKGVLVILTSFLAVFGPLVDDLLLKLGASPAGARRGLRKVSAARLQGMPLLAFLIRGNPSLGTVEAADAIDAGVQAGVTSRNAINKVNQLLVLLQDTERLEEGDAWKQASVAYKTGQAIARTDRSMATAMAPIQAALLRGPRVKTAATKAADQRARATAAQQRATKAQQVAATASRTAARATQAHADAHPTSAGAIPVSPVPLANPQGPAASADVAPQGPAPGPTPVTGR